MKAKAFPREPPLGKRAPVGGTEDRERTGGGGAERQPEKRWRSLFHLPSAKIPSFVLKVHPEPLQEGWEGGLRGMATAQLD